MAIIRRAKATGRSKDTGDQLAVVERIAKQGGEIVFGAPTRCPNCGKYGVVDGLRDGVQFNRCEHCAYRWSFSEQALGLFLGAREADRQAGTVVGDGVLLSGMTLEGFRRMTREHFVNMRSTIGRTRDVIFRKGPTGR